MGRWQPDARGRLTRAALELYAEHGFEQTTVAAIADRAGVTERTFFRHFADKREVLFDGRVLQDYLVAELAASPAGTAPMDAIVQALKAAGETFFAERIAHSRQRQAIINANPSLQERELIKMATLSAAFASALRRRGHPDPTATVAAEAGIVVFRVGFERWVADGNEQSFAELIQATREDLRAVGA